MNRRDLFKFAAAGATTVAVKENGNAKVIDDAVALPPSGWRYDAEGKRRTHAELRTMGQGFCTMPSWGGKPVIMTWKEE